MAGPGGAGKTSALIVGGFLCLGLVLFAIAAAIILSLIPIYTSNSASQGYGSQYTIDAFMLRFTYQNSSGIFYTNGTVANNTDLSSTCTSYFQSLGYKNFAGCLVFSGQAWGSNSSTAFARRRRSITQTVDLIFIAKLTIYRTVSCPSVADKNKTEDSSGVSYCNQQAIKQCNDVVGGTLKQLVKWTLANTLILQIVDPYGYYNSETMLSAYGVPRDKAYTAAGTVSPMTDGLKNQLKYGCRYVQSLPISTINTILASQTASSVSNTATTQPSG